MSAFVLGVGSFHFTRTAAFCPWALAAGLLTVLLDLGAVRRGDSSLCGSWAILSPLNPPCLTFSEQVFHVPLEERKYKDMNQFGEGEQAKICLEIMQRTGAHLELSLAKDQGLSIMVSGKLDAVMKARKDIVARLQTQVRAPNGPSPGGCLALWLRLRHALSRGGQGWRVQVGQQHSEPPDSASGKPVTWS